MWPIDRPKEWVGRVHELAILTAAVETLRLGRGSAVWIEGEPGIGKSALVAQALTVASDPGWDIGWGAADPLGERLPLWVMQDCLRVRPGSDDPRRARAAAVLRDGRLGLFASGDAPTAGIETLLALVDTLCTDDPAVVVIDDMQWADSASLVTWHQLAVSADRLPLLLIATCRPRPQRAEVRALRAAAERRGATMVELGPLPDADVAALVTTMLGAPPGDTLRRLTAQAAGNPLYLRELAGALVREQQFRIRADAAELSPASGRLPGSLAAALDGRLSVSAEAGQMLRTAALLGNTFAVTDLAVLLGRPASALAAAVQETVAAGLLAGSGPGLSFRHPLIRWALYENMPEALRTALHAEGAEELAARGASVLSVAQQLSMAGRPGGKWTRSWLVTAAPALTTRAPRLAAELLRREADETRGTGEAPDGLMASLARALLAAGSYTEAASSASQALAETADPVRMAETYVVMARAHVSAGHGDKGIAVLRQALTRAELPRTWYARTLALLGALERAATGDLDAADATARRALAIGEETGDAFATAQALTGLWQIHSIRRNHVAALDDIDRALRVLGDHPGYADLRSCAFDNRVFTLQNLDRWRDAEATIRQASQAASQAARHDQAPDRGTWVVAAVQRYWAGKWDDALAKLEPGEHDVPGLTYTYLREGWPTLLAHGVSALVAGRRDQRTTARGHLRQGLALPVRSLSDRENRDFLVAAQALAFEQSGDTRQAMRALAALVPRQEGEMTLTHQWLPDLVRLAIAAGDKHLARSAAQACEAEAAAETQPARAAAASLRCRGLLRSDPVPLRDAVAHYREAGPLVELPAALEDLAAVLAAGGGGEHGGDERGGDEDARTALNEAVTLYEGLGALWDIRRADGRLRAFGIRRGTRGPRGPRATSGWDALTPTETKIAALIGAGQSTSAIATGMFLSRRTVQKHVSSILAKLGAKSRVEIVREVLFRGITM